MPTDKVTPVHPRLLLDGIVEYQHPVLGSDLTDSRFDLFPQIFGCELSVGEKTCESVMTYAAVRHVRQTGSRGVPGRHGQIISVEIKVFCIHALNVLYFGRLRNIRY